MILTPDQRLRVFISSTLDLTEERAAARRSIESLHLTPIMFEAGARPHPPRALYRAYLEQSDVFVAIYAARYGWTAPEMDVSGLEDEYNLSAGKPRLVYIKAAVEREPALDSFLEQVREGGLSYKPFSAGSDLERLVREDLVVLLTERFHATREAMQEQLPQEKLPAQAALPVPPTLFLGREAELAEIAARLERDDTRLLTLVGPGGIGKTRLAIAAGHRFREDFPGGTFFVSLAALREPQLIGETIAAALEVATSDGSSPTAAIVDFLRARRALLILDNFEQVIPGAPTVAELLSACAALKVVVTSRAPLRLRGEREVDVAPLAVPAGLVPSEQLSGYSAVQLFVESVREFRPSFEINDRSSPAIVAICQRLDGLPLAIELAAALMRVLTPQALLDRLGDRITDLSGGLRDLPARHQSLNDTIAWSYDLLDEPTRELFLQLSAFRGGFTLESAERVCEVEGDVLAGIGSLVEQSLLRADVAERGARFQMLGTIQQFARRRLDESLVRDRVLARHGRAFVELAAGVGRPGGRLRTALDAVEDDLDNIRRAFQWFLANGDPDPVANAMWESWWFWWMRGYVREGKLWADRCLAAADLGRESRSHALAARAMLAIWSAEYELAVPAFLEAAETARETGDRRSVAYADIGVGLVRAVTTSVEEGTVLIQRGVTTFEEIGDEPGATTGLAATSWVQAITRQFHDTSEVLQNALDRVRRSGSEVEVGIIEASLAQLHMSRGETDLAYPLIQASLDHVAAARHIGSTILTLEVIAELGLAGGRAGAAVPILGATASIRSAMGTRVPPHAAARLERLNELGRQQLSGDYAAALARGSAMGFSDAVEQGRVLITELQRTATRS